MTLGTWPDDPRPFASSREVATRLGFSLKQFRRQRPRLDALGFPPPALGRLWRRAHVDAWDSAQDAGAAHAPAPSPGPPPQGSARIFHMGLEKLRRNT